MSTEGSSSVSEQQQPPQQAQQPQQQQQQQVPPPNQTPLPQTPTSQPFQLQLPPQVLAQRAAAAASSPVAQSQPRPDGTDHAPTPTAEGGTPRSASFSNLPQPLAGPSRSPAQTSTPTLPQGLPPQVMTSLMNLSNNGGFNDQQAQHARNLLAHMAANQSKMAGQQQQQQPGQAGRPDGASPVTMGTPGGPGRPGSSGGLQQPQQQQLPEGEQRRVSGQQDLSSMASAMGMLSNMRGGASKDAMLRQLQVLTQAARARQQTGSPTGGAPSPAASTSALQTAPSPAASLLNGHALTEGAPTPNRPINPLPMNTGNPTDGGANRPPRPPNSAGPASGSMGPPMRLPAGMDPQAFLNLPQQQKEFIFAQQRARAAQMMQQQQQQQQQQQVGMGRPSSAGGSAGQQTQASFTQEARTPSSSAVNGAAATQAPTPQAQTAPSPVPAATPVTAPSPAGTAGTQNGRSASGPQPADAPTPGGTIGGTTPGQMTASAPATNNGAVRPPIRPPAGKFDPAEQRRQFLMSLGTYYRASGTAPPPEVFNGERDGCIKMGNVAWVELADLFMFVMRAGGVSNIVKHGQDSSVWQHFLTTKQIPNPLPEAVPLPRQAGLDLNAAPTMTNNPIQFLMAVFFVYLQGFETYMTRQRQVGLAMRHHQQAAQAAIAAGRPPPPPPPIPPFASSAVVAASMGMGTLPSAVGGATAPPHQSQSQDTPTAAAMAAPSPATAPSVSQPSPATAAPTGPGPASQQPTLPNAPAQPKAQAKPPINGASQKSFDRANPSSAAPTPTSRPTPAPIRTDLPMAQSTAATPTISQQSQATATPAAAAPPTAPAGNKKRKKKAAKDAASSSSSTPATAVPPSATGFPGMGPMPGMAHAPPDAHSFAGMSAQAPAAQAPPPAKRARYKVEYKPLHHPRQYLAGWDERAVASTFPKNNLSEPTRSIHELGIVDMETILMGLRSRLTFELGYALTVLSMLSMPHPEENIGGLPLHHLREIYEELLGLVEEAAFGEDGFAAWEKRISAAQININDNDGDSTRAGSLPPGDSSVRFDPNTMPFAELEQLGLDFDFSLDDAGDNGQSAPGQSGMRASDGRSTHIVLTGINILRNFSMLPDNQALMAQVPELFHLLSRITDARLARLPGQPASPDKPFSLLEIARVRRDAVMILANVGAHVDLRSVSSSSVAAISRLLSTFLRSGWNLLTQRESMYGSQPPARVVPPPVVLSVNHALEAFCNLSHYDSNREILGKLPLDELVALFEGLVKLFPISKRGFDAMLALEDSLAFVECLSLSLYSLVFLSSPATRAAMRATSGTIPIILRVISVTALQGQADPKQNPFAVLCRRLCEMLAVLNGTVSASGDVDIMSFSAAREAAAGKEGRGWTFRSKVVQPGWLAGDEERLVQVMSSRGLDSIAHGELDAMLWAT